MEAFSKKEAIVFGWNTLQERFFFYIGVTAVTFAISMLLGSATQPFEETLPVMVGVIMILATLVEWWLTLGLLYIALKATDKMPATFADLFSQQAVLLNYVGAVLLYVLIVAGGLVLLIVPGIVWAVKFSLFPYIIVDEGLSPVAALKQSARLTAGVKWDLFLFNLLLGLINMLGILALGVGILISAPVSIIASAYVFRQLHKRLEPVVRQKVSSPL
jgi:uncharacterized membrane protein